VILLRTGVLMVHGFTHGIDIVSVARMGLAVRRSGDRFLNRVFTQVELASGEEPGFLASRFAVKEAFFKALGTGLAGGVRWHDFELPPGNGAVPVPVVSGRSLELLAGRRVYASVSRTGSTVVAVVLLAAGTE
jgi:holo-[acyl-carrier protein] synthase